MVNYLSLEQVKTLHNLIDPGITVIKDEAALQDALAGPQATVLGEDAYSTVDEKAAVLLDHMIKEKPFKTANRRTGLLTYLVFLYVNNHQITVSSDKLVELVDSVAVKHIPISDILAFTRHSTTVIQPKYENFSDVANFIYNHYEEAFNELS
ncbi:death-on-curing family protein [Desulfofarcimen acetoxidans DSM 771]|jgi:death-on-curing protein|uniref:Death-on-curing family protein n=1 Tax=Desulfofarcimen acetoxidans (strain ATCC 49208 / DSM 771 / KCTC 5769 / VKM B-1644 / 5575) TaxID=485916 RepID=C8W3H9_DESAS|nr:type II toxin-antitoxin system death-on-curing family toxin [Desulfofarcimen acetoxidans]ACV63765.1 death-on-curing family protein [Desulfofarcimen acetoxidans DSM 771]